MINIENLKTKPLHDLLVYREALLTLIDKYEKTIMPRFSMADPRFEKIDASEMEGKAKLHKLQGYLASLMILIEEKTIMELEAEVTEVKTKENVRKSKKKD